MAAMGPSGIARMACSHSKPEAPPENPVGAGHGRDEAYRNRTHGVLPQQTRSATGKPL